MGSLTLGVGGGLGLRPLLPAAAAERSSFSRRFWEAPASVSAGCWEQLGAAGGSFSSEDLLLPEVLLLRTGVRNRKHKDEFRHFHNLLLISC